MGVNLMSAGPRRPKTCTSVTADASSPASTLSAISVGRRSTACFASTRATSSATLPLPITATSAASRGHVGRHVGVAVVPGDEVGGAVRAGQVDARDVERGVADRAGREDHGVVALLQLVERDVAADLDVADEADRAGIQHLVQRSDDALDARVVGGDAVADEAVRRGERLEEVDRDGCHRPARRGSRGCCRRRFRRGRRRRSRRGGSRDRGGHREQGPFGTGARRAGASGSKRERSRAARSGGVRAESHDIARRRRRRASGRRAPPPGGRSWRGCRP